MDHPADRGSADPCSMFIHFENCSLTPSQFLLLFWSNFCSRCENDTGKRSIHLVWSTVFFSGSHLCIMQHDIKPPRSLLTMQANLFPHLSPLTLLPFFSFFMLLVSLSFSQLHTSVPEWRNVPQASAVCLQVWLHWEGMWGKVCAYTPISCLGWEWTQRRRRRRRRAAHGSPAAHPSADALRRLCPQPLLQECRPDEAHCQVQPPAQPSTLHPAAHPAAVSTAKKAAFPFTKHVWMIDLYT